MHFPTLTTLCFHFLFCQLVTSSRYTLSKNDTIHKDDFDNVLEKFFVNLKKVYLQKYKPRHIAVVGASTKDLQQAQPLFESYPYSVCKRTERCVYSQRFTQRSFVLVFLEDLSKETFGKNIEILSPCRRCEVLFVFNGTTQVNDIRFILTLALRHNVPYAKFAHLKKDAIELFSDFVATNCTMEVRLVATWRPAAGLDKINRWAFRTRDMNGCPVSVSSLTFIPKMIIKESEDDSLTIVGGREGMLLLALAAKLNFTIKLRYPSVEDQLKYSRKVAILKDVATGTSEIGIGRLRPTTNVNLNNSIAISFPYDEECETWGVPRVMKWSNNIIWVEFSWRVWTSVGLVFALGCIITYVHRNIATSKNGQRTSLGLVTILLDAISLHLGNPVLHVSSYLGGRFTLIAYLYYAIVITTAYKTSLASILATNEATPTIVDAQGIINANLDVGGSLYDYNILKDQMNDSVLTLELLKRFVINNNGTETWNRLLFDQNYAFLARRSALDFARQMIIKSHEHVTYDVLNDCVLAHPTVMVFQARSFLRKPVDEVIQRLVESGIMRYWDSDKFDSGKHLKQKMAEKYFEKRAVYKFWNIFILYSVCIFISLLTFMIELFVPKLYLSKRRHAVDQIHDT